MAVPTPLSPTAGDKLSAAVFNSGVRDPLNFLMNPPRVHAYTSTAVSIPDTDVLTLITMDGEIYDTDTMHSTSSNTSRIVFTTAGLYEIDALMSFAPATYTALRMQVNLNAAGASGGGTILRTEFYDKGAGNTGPFTFQRFFTAGDYIEVFVAQQSGGAKTTANSTSGIYGSRVFARWVAIS